MSKGSRWLVATGDLHVGSPVALCPPRFEFDDGGLYQRNTLQDWLWDGWLKCWADAKKLIGREPWEFLCNGDLIEGDHHRNKQVITTVIGCQIRAAMDCLDVPLAMKPRRIHLVRGTEAHVGTDTEEGIARQLRKNGHRVVKDPDTGMATSQWRRFRMGGKLVEARHHGRMGQRAHTRASYSRLYAFDIWANHTLDGDEPPALSIRSHHHRFMDSGPDHRGVTRVVTLPAWQMLTSFVHRIASEEMPWPGVVVFRVDERGVEVFDLLHKPARPTVIGEVA